MTDEQIALARRAVACKGWRWLPGTRTTDAMRVIHDETAFPGRPCAIREGSWVDTSPPRPLGDALPDLTDPATLGCVLALVREAWSDPAICVVLDLSDGYWHVGRWEDEGIALRGRWGTTEAHALTLALEGAP
jgi:hypothetical protein